MTAEEALNGFQEISRRFKQGYKWGELEGIWSELLQYCPQAMSKAVWMICKNWKYRPDPEDVLQKVKWWDMNLEPAVEAEVQRVAGRDPDQEGREAAETMRLFFRGDIDRQEYARRLFSLSERYGKPGYAMSAKDILAGAAG